MKTLDLLLEEAGFTAATFADRCRLTPARIEAIANGRWTPSPDERDRIANALDVPVEEIIWGHTMDGRNVRYRQFGLKEDF